MAQGQLTFGDHRRSDPLGDAERTAILASPKFLYRAEKIPMGVPPGSPYRLSDLDLASRLSFFLW